MDDVGDAHRVPVAQLADDVVCELVVAGVLEHVDRGEVGVGDGERGVDRVFLVEFAGVLRDVVPRAVALPVTVVAAAARHEAVRVERQVADLAGVAVPAGEDVPVDADPRADTGGDGEVHHVVGVAVGVEPLADDAGVRVVVQVHLVRLQQHREGTGQRDAVDGVREVRRVFDRALGQVERADCTDTGRDRVARVDARLGTRLADDAEDRLGDRDSRRAARSVVTGLSEDGSIVVADHGTDVRRPQVDAHVVRHRSHRDAPTT